MSSYVTVKHNFETAHRLPRLGGKCINLHGHSWWTEVTVTGPKNGRGVVAEFAALKGGLRHWIDNNLDHGVMLGFEDTLNEPLRADGCKVFTFGSGGDETPAGRFTEGLWWPTVENVAEMLARVARDVAAPLGDLFVSRVKVMETHVNAAEWTP